MISLFSSLGININPANIVRSVIISQAAIALRRKYIAEGSDCTLADVQLHIA